MSLHEKVDRLLTLLPTKVKGKEKVTHSSLQPPSDIDDFKIKDYSDLESFLEKKFKGGVQPIDTDNFIEGEPSNKKDFHDSLNKISEKYARKPVQRMFYYPRPTPQDVLLEEHEHIITNSYNGKEIYEWNIDGYTDRQIFTTVHRMLMYSTICKTNKNSDKSIADMITAGFTGQLKGWWDNYLNQTQRDIVLLAVKQEGDQVTQNTVYTLVLNIIEHFSGRWYGHYAKDCRVKEKIKNLDIDDNLKDSLYKIMLNSDSESGSAYSSRDYSLTSEDLKALQQEEYLISKDECSPCQ
ncbi:hypothetical protein H5410_063774 [Solanum commersonii]|uniref:DUF7746 domain-containing protein n=1 Tax=Solanum commersonii TaxID=4109 RepID=A0A9J5WGB9_SOLCO|nr:hypothetical protein H5410_063774 [Solanum commersonii]